MAETPARVWIDLDQFSIGYTAAPSEATPHDTPFVPEARLLAMIDAVRALRDAQRAYFKDRTRDALIRSKEAEKVVDQLLNRSVQP